MVPLINWEISLILNCYKECLIPPLAAESKTFTITDTKIYFPILILPTQDNADVFEQLKSGVKIMMNWNKYQSK